MPESRFPPPWNVEQQAACFVVRDRNGSGVEKQLQLLPILGETFRISSMDNFLRVVGT